MNRTGRDFIIFWDPFSNNYNTVIASFKEDFLLVLCVFSKTHVDVKI